MTCELNGTQKNKNKIKMMDVNFLESNEASEIVKYYRGKSIFVTGATGFLGKVLIEKLLRSCYDLKKIYILIRHKKEKTPAQRLNELVNCQVHIT